MNTTDPAEFNITEATVVFWTHLQGRGWLSNQQLQKSTGLMIRTVRHHTTRLYEAGALEKGMLYPRQYRVNETPTKTQAKLIDKLNRVADEIRRRTPEDISPTRRVA